MRRFIKNTLCTKLLALCFLFSGLCFVMIDNAGSGTYLSTKHGNNTSGVDRSAVGAVNPAITYNKGHCGHCHEQHASIDGQEPSPPTRENAPVSYALFKNNSGGDTNGANKNTLCYACHETFSFGYGAGYGRYGVYQGKVNYQASVHNTATNMKWPGPTPAVQNQADYGNCHNCHNPHGYNDGSGVIPSMVFSREENLCNTCHDGSPATKDIKTLVTTKTYKHNVGGYANLHKPGWNAGQEDRTYLSTAGAAKKHVECADCHNPHTATAANPTAKAPGVNPTNNATNFGAPTAFTERSVTGGTDEYQICFRCHSSYISTYVYNSSTVSYSGTWNDAGAWTDLAREFNTNNSSYHWVEGDKGASKMNGSNYGNFYITGSAYAYKMMPRYNGYTNVQLRAASMRCSDCHGPDGANPPTTANGPHGSIYDNILKVPSGSTYTVWNNLSKVGDTNIWCFNCHDSSFTNSGFSGVDGSLHTAKHNGQLCMDCHVKIPHGWSTPRLVKSTGLSTLSPYQGKASTTGVVAPTWKASGTWTESSCNPHQNCT